MQSFTHHQASFKCNYCKFSAKYVYNLHQSTVDSQQTFEDNLKIQYLHFLIGVMPSKCVVFLPTIMRNRKLILILLTLLPPSFWSLLANRTTNADLYLLATPPFTIIDQMLECQFNNGKQKDDTGWSISIMGF